VLYKNYKQIESYQGEEAYTVVIVEPRASMQKALEFIIHNTLDNLASNWTVFIFPGQENILAVQTFINSLPPEKKLRVEVKDIGLTSLTIAQYNELMMSTRLLDHIPTEVFLVVQTDSMICSPGKDLVYKFIQYDYSGAPWFHNEVGNGGFSLRRKSKMLEVLNSCSKYYGDGATHNEDGYFSRGCDNVQVSKASVEDAQEFSVEQVYRGKQMFGIHKAWAYVSTDLDAVCPGYATLRSLN
jgi:hypothetical protein